MVDFFILEGKDPLEVEAIIGFGIADSTRIWMQQHGFLQTGEAACGATATC